MSRMISRLGHFRIVFAVLCITSTARCADWQVGRIEQVRKDVSSKTLYYVVNTPVTEDTTTYTISVHVQNRLVTASYDLDKLQSEPPVEWTENTPVWVQISDKTMFLKSATSGEYKLTISKSKSVAVMQPLTLDEIKVLNAGARQVTGNTAVGFGAKEAAQSQPQPVEAAQPAPQPPGGTLDISTVPYLADVFVDGKDMGYSPAKIRVSPGKHSVKVSKNGYQPYVKEVVVALDSEQKLDVTLEKKP
jgi:PEGA domain-containing protein